MKPSVDGWEQTLAPGPPSRSRGSADGSDPRLALPRAYGQLPFALVSKALFICCKNPGPGPTRFAALLVGRDVRRGIQEVRVLDEAQNGSQQNIWGGELVPQEVGPRGQELIKRLEAPARN
jgi:hypothetical protein